MVAITLHNKSHAWDEMLGKRLYGYTNDNMDISYLYYESKDRIVSCYIFPGIDLIGLEDIDHKAIFLMPIAIFLIKGYVF